MQDNWDNYYNHHSYRGSQYYYYMLMVVDDQTVSDTYDNMYDAENCRNRRSGSSHRGRRSGRHLNEILDEKRSLDQNHRDHENGDYDDHFDNSIWHRERESERDQCREPFRDYNDYWVEH